MVSPTRFTESDNVIYNYMSDQLCYRVEAPNFVRRFSALSGLFSPVVTAIVAGHAVSVEKGINYV
jgi:hypothetical protein